MRAAPDDTAAATTAAAFLRKFRRSIRWIRQISEASGKGVRPLSDP
jgi:hypothetical protein